jgi:hypothetical protein
MMALRSTSIAGLVGETGETSHKMGRFSPWILGTLWLEILWFPKMEVPQNGWFIVENPIKTDDMGVPPF